MKILVLTVEGNLEAYLTYLKLLDKRFYSIQCQKLIEAHTECRGHTWSTYRQQRPCILHKNDGKLPQVIIVVVDL